MKILIATSNAHKLEEIRAVAGEIGIVFVSLKEEGVDVPEPVEDQPTFEGNALLKATYYAQASGLPCLADDSGLEVDALGGEPGVRSARYAGVTGGRDVVDPANNAKLMRALGQTPADERAARFVCAMSMCWPGGSEAADPADQPPLSARGTFEGRIITPDQADDPAQPEKGRGVNGFGYDPLFWLAERGCTSAELEPRVKNELSHRGDATRKMITLLRDRLFR
ncbi:MAG: non-canonical purine NTP pyrophosphatase [Planctomycetota bacterium]